MNAHALWYIRRDGHVVGPFVEALVCRYIALGRINDRDELSLDGHLWHKLDELPELIEGVDQLLGLGPAASHDPQWREERIKASLRWLDERVSLDRREQDASTSGGQRQRDDRRASRETPEQHVYRHAHSTFESWLRSRQRTYQFGIGVFIAAMMLVVAGAFVYRPDNPVKVGFFLPSDQCDQIPVPGINWAGCDKMGALLVGVNLQHANLERASFSGANLSYSNFSETVLDGADLRAADLRRANFRNAHLQGADFSKAQLEGAQLDGALLSRAVWVDGKICKEGSVGVCR